VRMMDKTSLVHYRSKNLFCQLVDKTYFVVYYLAIVHMRDLSYRQTKYRYYLQSEVWRKKRLEALEFYGAKCSRCGGYGNDVHHKTYERVGGQELMEDLEVMCRECHEAHHRAYRCYKPSNKHKRKIKSKGIHERALRGYLTPTQKGLIMKTFSIDSENDLVLKIMRLDRDLCDFAARLLGFSYVYRNTGRSFHLAAIDAKKKGKKMRTRRLGSHGTTTEGY